MNVFFSKYLQREFKQCGSIQGRVTFTPRAYASLIKTAEFLKPWRPQHKVQGTEVHITLLISGKLRTLPNSRTQNDQLTAEDKVLHVCSKNYGGELVS